MKATRSIATLLLLLDRACSGASIGIDAGRQCAVCELATSTADTLFVQLDMQGSGIPAGYDLSFSVDFRMNGEPFEPACVCLGGGTMFVNTPGGCAVAASPVTGSGVKNLYP
jgi:hypothetical protein